MINAGLKHVYIDIEKNAGAATFRDDAMLKLISVNFCFLVCDFRSFMHYQVLGHLNFISIIVRHTQAQRNNCMALQLSGTMQF